MNSHKTCNIVNNWQIILLYIYIKIIMHILILSILNEKIEKII